jgi:hypothetical protein
MDKLYRLVSADGFGFSALGVPLGVRVNDQRFLERIRSYLPPSIGSLRSSVVRRLYSFVVQRQADERNIQKYQLLYANQQLLRRAINEDELLDSFESDVNHYAAAETRQRFVLHAGVVGWKGRAIVMPGYSCTGKTTLVREFVRRGAVYLSDEFAVLDLRGYVHPYPTPLGVRESKERKQMRLSPTEIDCAIATKSLPVGLVLVTNFQKNARWRPASCSHAKGVLSMIANSFSVRENPEGVLNACANAIHSALVLKGVRGDAKKVVEYVFEYLERHRHIGLQS